MAWKTREGSVTPRRDLRLPAPKTDCLGLAPDGIGGAHEAAQ